MMHGQEKADSLLSLKMSRVALQEVKRSFSLANVQTEFNLTAGKDDSADATAFKRSSAYDAQVVAKANLPVGSIGSLLARPPMNTAVRCEKLFDFIRRIVLVADGMTHDLTQNALDAQGPYIV